MNTNEQLARIIELLEDIRRQIAPPPVKRRRERAAKTADIYEELGVTRRHMNYLLVGRGNASPELARRIEATTGIDKAVFVFGSVPERRAEWKRYLKSLEA